jgi:hypothetical protein
MTDKNISQPAPKPQNKALSAVEFVWKGLFDSKIKRAVEPGKYEDVERETEQSRLRTKYLI